MINLIRRLHLRRTMSLIEKILDDHMELRTYKDKFLETGYDKWFNQFVWELTRHHVGEEIVVYPLLEQLGERGKELAKQGQKEHHQLKLDLDKIKNTLQKDEINVLMKDLVEHLDNEEKEDLPLLKEKITPDELEAAGKAFEFRKAIAPTHNHPKFPEDSVTIETALGLLAAPIDKLRDLMIPFPSKEELKEAEDAMK
eukprot:NODE_779_length_3939_cov_0.376563.p3 type:complete len:198 gc:universal NODE_779_length_3939_cov_0.376563:1132-539(-)